MEGQPTIITGPVETPWTSGLIRPGEGNQRGVLQGWAGRAVSFLHHCERKRAWEEDSGISVDPAPVAWLAWNLADFLLWKWGRGCWEWQAHLSAGPSLAAAGTDGHGRSDSAFSECLLPAGPGHGPQQGSPLPVLPTVWPRAPSHDRGAADSSRLWGLWGGKGGLDWYFEVESVAVSPDPTTELTPVY